MRKQTQRNPDIFVSCLSCDCQTPSWKVFKHAKPTSEGACKYQHAYKPNIYTHTYIYIYVYMDTQRDQCLATTNMEDPALYQLTKTGWSTHVENCDRKRG
jgi:hypothetical protein